MKEKLRHSQIKESWGISLVKRNAKESPTLWNRTTPDVNIKQREKVKISGNGTYYIGKFKS